MWLPGKAENNLPSGHVISHELVEKQCFPGLVLFLFGATQKNRDTWKPMFLRHCSENQMFQMFHSADIATARVPTTWRQDGCTSLKRERCWCAFANVRWTGSIPSYNGRKGATGVCEHLVALASRISTCKRLNHTVLVLRIMAGTAMKYCTGRLDMLFL